MLILTRKDNQTIKIDENIEIKIISLSKNSVKIGIDAPKNILILRGELAEEIANINKQAASQANSDFIAKFRENFIK